MKLSFLDYSGSFLLFIFFGSNSVFGQNLVANGNFEGVNICQKYEKDCSPKAWRASTLKLFSYKKEDRQGRFVELTLFDQAREYERRFAQTELICPLEVGNEYLIELSVKPNLFRVQEIHLGFSNATILTDKNFPGLFEQLSKATLAIPENISENKWVDLSISYTASGEEKFLTIGNFNSDQETLVEPLDKKKYKKLQKTYRPKLRVRYGFDDISITAKNQEAEICPDYEQRREEVKADSIRHSLDRIEPQEKSVGSKEEPPYFPTKEEAQESIPEKIILDNLQFDFNSSKLLEEDNSKLRYLLQVLNSNKESRIRVTGYTDTEGEEQYNLDLSLKRAEAVKNYLISQGVKSERMEVSGEGENNPIYTGENKELFYLNRRVEILFLN